MANEYLTLDELKATLGVTNNAQDARLQRALSAASRALDKACSRRGLRRFWPDTAYVARAYTATDPDLLEIHDAFDIQKVESDDDGDGTYERLWDASEWVAVPLNAALDGEPWTALQWRNPRNTASSTVLRRGFPTDLVGAVRVTAKHGWEAVPDAIVEATALLANRLQAREASAPFAVVGFGMDSVAVHIARTDPDVSGLIHDYIRDASARSVRLG